MDLGDKRVAGRFDDEAATSQRRPTIVEAQLLVNVQLKKNK